MVRSPRLFCSLILAASLTTVACCGSDPPPAPPKLSQLETQVFHFSCSLSSSCHKGASPAGMLNLEDRTYNALVRASIEVPSKQIVAPGDPNKSYLMDKLLGRSLPNGPPGEEWTSMPPGAPLESDRLELVRRWIAAGAKDD